MKNSNYSIHSIIFDLGNVIIKYDDYIFFRKISKHTKLSLNIISKIMFPLFERFSQGKINSSQFFNEALIKCELKNLSRNTFFKFFNSVFISLNYKILDFIITLKKIKKYNIYLLSNTNYIQFGFLQKSYKHLFKIFDDIFLSYELKCRKPNHEIFEIVLSSINIPPENCLFIDDMDDNIKTARILNINSILFLDENQFLNDLSKFIKFDF